MKGEKKKERCLRTGESGGKRWNSADQSENEGERRKKKGKHDTPSRPSKTETTSPEIEGERKKKKEKHRKEVGEKRKGKKNNSKKKTSVLCRRHCKVTCLEPS